jgi:hypothetical protein
MKSREESLSMKKRKESKKKDEDRTFVLTKQLNRTLSYKKTTTKREWSKLLPQGTTQLVVL